MRIVAVSLGILLVGLALIVFDNGAAWAAQIENAVHVGWHLFENLSNTQKGVLFVILGIIGLCCYMIYDEMQQTNDTFPVRTLSVVWLLAVVLYVWVIK